ncbi:MAG TPA: hypothetical protein VK869_10025 [Rubrobacteraceae bacterium]|nr:hypothetical protein [Rubrobacteraceae bacterium]
MARSTIEHDEQMVIGIYLESGVESGTFPKRARSHDFLSNLRRLANGGVGVRRYGRVWALTG